ncbi:response regulator [Aquimarina sp. LLG6339-5]|uniref:response regulator n=1 Tax=Aquimarina sp. LLG6339-5 TaxID=3160830 RepID=UPI003867AE6D
MIKICILDDHQMIIEGLESMLRTETDIDVINSFTHEENCYDFLKKEIPDVLLLDINLKNANGIEICGELSKIYSSLKIIGVSNYTEPGFIKNMLRSGAKGYLLKNTTQEELVNAIKVVMNDQTFLPRSVETILLNDSIGSPQPKKSVPKLTRREKEILQLISDEMTNSEIAEKLIVSIKTVESHRNNLLQKFGVKNAAGLIKNAMNMGFIS